MSTTIDPQSIPALYRKHKLRPMRGFVWNTWECRPRCCILGIMVYDQTGLPASDTLSGGETLGFSELETIAITAGFDGVTLTTLMIRSTPNAEALHRIGRESWEACVKAGLTVDRPRGLRGFIWAIWEYWK